MHGVRVRMGSVLELKNCLKICVRMPFALVLRAIPHGKTEAFDIYRINLGIKCSLVARTDTIIIYYKFCIPNVTREKHN
jgi:hypothetical protein